MPVMKMVTKKRTLKRRSGIFQVISDGVVFEMQPEPEGGYTVSVPALPGCISYGKNFEEAMAMIRDAMDGWLAVAREEGVPVPYHLDARN